MVFYFGTDLLKKMQQYYEARFSLAIKSGFECESDRYHWLYVELELRVDALRRSLALIDALPAFMTNNDPEAVFSIVIHHITVWFSYKNIGEGPKDAEGRSVYFSNENPYCSDFMKVSDRFTVDYDYTKLGEFYLDITEYIVTALRLYFAIREAQFRPIDRGKYDDLVSISGTIARSA